MSISNLDHTSASNSDIDLGKNISQIRKKYKIPIRDLAEKVGVSASMLSQIERGLANPSIATMKAIADALGEPLYNFFLPDSLNEEKYISRAATRRRFSFEPPQLKGEGDHLPSGYICEHLSTADSVFESFRVTLPPHCATSPLPRMHKEDEASYVESGTVDIQFEDCTKTLYPHDAVSIPANVAHRWINNTDESVYLILTNIKELY